MKVFISWSGDLSRELAEALRDWLPAVLQSVKPFFTPNDIEKGARWGKDIAQELHASAVGIFCLTKENLSKPWIMFEAGALSKQVDSSRVCPVLFGVESADLEGPLVQFQASPFSEVEMRKLIGTLNSELGDQSLGEGVLNDVFKMWWPQLNDKVKKILDKFKAMPGDKSATRSDRDLLEEVLELTRLSSLQTTKVRRTVSTGESNALLHALRHLLLLAQRAESEGASSGTFTCLKEIVSPLRFLSEKGDSQMRVSLDHDEIFRKISLIVEANEL